MKPVCLPLARAALCALIFVSSTAFAAGDDDDDDKTTTAGTSPALNAEQQRVVGIVVAHPAKANAPERIQAFGMVLDPAVLVAESGEVRAGAASEDAAAAEAERLRGLYSAGAGASLKALQTAQAEQARAHAQADSAKVRFAQHWGPLVALPVAERQTLIDAAAKGGSLLVRADVPGRHTWGTIPERAMLDVDDIQVPGRVLGALPQAGADAQGAGLLVVVENAPAGLGPGARLPIALVNPARAGLLLPRGALLYEEGGAFVYKQLGRKADDGKTRYAAVKVKLLLAYGDGWLVDGVDDDDNVVVHGAGVLWSLQGLSGKSAGDDDDD
ncbi:MAG: hypothetical protein P4L92_09125 [Rudaea sp.]|nr:hypothetical protein [Rudaea sp.]